MGDVMSLDQLDKVKADTEEILEDIASMTGQLNELWWNTVGAKPSSNAIKTTTQHNEVKASNIGAADNDLEPGSTTLLCDVKGSGRLFAVVVHKNTAGLGWIRVTVDGKPFKLKTEFTDLGTYHGYYATASCDGNLLPTSLAIKITDIKSPVDVKEEALLTGNYERQGSARTQYPISFSKSLKVECACVTKWDPTTTKNSTSLTYELNN